MFETLYKPLIEEAEKFRMLFTQATKKGDTSAIASVSTLMVQVSEVLKTVKDPKEREALINSFIGGVLSEKNSEKVDSFLKTTLSGALTTLTSGESVEKVNKALNNVVQNFLLAIGENGESIAKPVIGAVHSIIGNIVTVYASNVPESIKFRQDLLKVVSQFSSGVADIIKQRIMDLTGVLNGALVEMKNNGTSENLAALVNSSIEKIDINPLAKKATSSFLDNLFNSLSKYFVRIGISSFLALTISSISFIFVPGGFIGIAFSASIFLVTFGLTYPIVNRINVWARARTHGNTPLLDAIEFDDGHAAIAPSNSDENLPSNNSESHFSETSSSTTRNSTPFSSGYNSRQNSDSSSDNEDDVDVFAPPSSIDTNIDIESSKKIDKDNPHSETVRTNHNDIFNVGDNSSNRTNTGSGDRANSGSNSMK